MWDRLALIVAILALIIITSYTFAKLSVKDEGFSNPTLRTIRSNFAQIDPEYAKIPLKEGDSSYTEDKSSITLCLKDPQTGKIYDMNTLMYVSLHELAHVVCYEEDHTPLFKKYFADMLEKAEKLGIYNPNQPLPETYCGIKS